VQHAKKTARELFFNNKWEKQIHPLSWLVEKFWPVPGWSADDLAKIKEAKLDVKVTELSAPIPVASDADTTNASAGVVYYTDCQLDPNILRACQEQLEKAANGKRIVSVSLKQLSFGDNIVLPLERGYLTMFKQILAGLEELETDYVYFAEHDVLYHSTHFEFVPSRSDVYYYNTNVWKLRISDGHALHYDCQQTSGLCARRDLLLRHYRERVRRTEQKFAELGNTHEYRNWIRKQGFEPGSHNRSERVDDYKAASWRSLFPNIDIRHDGNLTPSRWSKDQFRDQRFTAGWTEAEEVPGWDKGIDIARSLYA
jgi:hypothetical protein